MTQHHVTLFLLQLWKFMEAPWNWLLYNDFYLMKWTGFIFPVQANKIIFDVPRTLGPWRAWKIYRYDKKGFISCISNHKICMVLIHKMDHNEEYETKQIFSSSSLNKNDEKPTFLFLVGMFCCAMFNEPCHEKNCFCPMRTIKVHISLRWLLSTFVVPCLDSIISLLAIAEISRL